MVEERDIPGICDLYARRLNYRMSKELYHHFYRSRYADNEADFTSVVAEEAGQIVGHNALILNRYLYQERPVIVGLSSGGMVEEQFSGIFYPLLKQCFQFTHCDAIIAFPNQQSQGFFTRIFAFETIRQNCFKVTADTFQPQSPLFPQHHWQRSEDHVNWRLGNDPRYSYQRLKSGEQEIWFKPYEKKQLDLMYVSEYSAAVLAQMQRWLSEFQQINFVHWDENFCRSIGAEPVDNNVFVYQTVNDDLQLVSFECQMIDSDVF